MIAYKIVKSSLLLALLTLFVFASCNKRSGKPKVLVFSKTAGFYHESIPDGIAAIQKLGAENGFDVDTTTNAELFNEENLKQYAAVIWLSTTGDVLNHYQEADFERYIQAGGGFVGIHAASDTEYHWGWYNRLVGGYFSYHPGIGDPYPNVQEGTLNVTDRKHQSTRFLPEIWNRRDEWYHFKKLNPDVNVLMDIDEESYQHTQPMGFHPMAWYHEYDGGRAWYTAGGHTKESFTEELFLQHILEGIKYAMGDNKKLDYSKAKTQRLPEENRFEKTQLVLGEFTEPTEMTILPNLDILIAQRRGEVLLYKNGDSTVSEVAKFDVYWKTDVPGVNAEEGLMGIQKDPNFSKNGYVFVFYSPAGDQEINRLSRFTFKNDTWDMASEKVILELYSQRNICCHTGGSIAFDKDGLLYLSTGDNSTPFDQANSRFVNRGYAPLDDRPGFEQFDARRSSGNSNDLRGKIIRIKVNEDGSYSIPAGNLYPQGVEGARPEIYVQGNRNPYRISVDQKTGFLYWGEVGPDANVDSLSTRGPRGYDEVNQARKAGNFGWPYFVGDNYAYVEYDYATGKSGSSYDVSKPVNNSRNNTGLRELPPAEPAFIWYPYGISDDFPQLGTGGRNAMAGPVYYSDMFPKESRYPAYYDGKLFIYDWVRGWIKVVTMQENGDFDKMEPFMSSTKFNAMIDMEVGPDGKIYILEYGNGWFSKNPDSGLSRIDFNAGNRSPVVTGIAVDKTSGALPFTATFTVEASDPENDPLSFTWDLGTGEKITTKEPSLTYTFKEIGDFDVQVEVSDPAKLSAKSTIVSVYAGNIAPEVNIQILGNQSFYFPGQSVSYSITVNDPDDPAAGDDLSTLYVSADYISGMDQAEASKGHLIMTEAMIGKSLVSTLTCKTCHKEDEASIGPSYVDVARKYRRNADAASYLINKIQKGGGGVWGETVMPANPDLKFDDASKITSYILSLGRRTAEKPSLPASGSIDPTVGKVLSPTGVFVLSASFTDRGGDNIKPLTGNTSVALKNPTMSMGQVRNLEGASTMNFNGMDLLILPSAQASFMIPQIDLTDIGSLVLTGGGQEASRKGFAIELRLGSISGEKIGEGVFKVSSQGEGGLMYGMGVLPIKEPQAGKLQDIYVISKALEGDEPNAALMSLEFKRK
ncbi:ThuA domain-containing protein [Cecembia lonarensis]|uniref:Soluble aldose sugar dehydrogenase yliI n=1 Tax=Cecembia lonarensis (strain CCUG 58316 / KCTC 22772 / LW9) TaxID=1225176 RepID=K1LHZ0_CECL9|nr:ThuA domain-containing protein [Cecembia lonarensis]EKB49883.1 Soluble aldose sugar dehydrogenase yliI precursor [Cecembia lonarensis LW9]